MKYNGKWVDDHAFMCLADKTWEDLDKVECHSGKNDSYVLSISNKKI